SRQDVGTVRVSRTGVKLDDVRGLAELLRPQQVEHPLSFLRVVELSGRVAPALVRKDERRGEVFGAVGRSTGGQLAARGRHVPGDLTGALGHVILRERPQTVEFSLMIELNRD